MKSEAETKRTQRERMRAAGYVLKQIWILPRDWPRVRKFLNQFRRIK
jgi:hypothetical protein